MALLASAYVAEVRIICISSNCVNAGGPLLFVANEMQLRMYRSVTQHLTMAFCIVVNKRRGVWRTTSDPARM